MGAWEWRFGSPTIELSDELARLLGAQPGEPFLRSNFSRYVHPEDIAEREAAATRALQTGQGYESRFRVVRGTGEVRYCRGRTEVEWDIALPGITGTQLARHLLERGFRGRLVLVSGYPADELSKHADLASQVTVLQKPWQLPEMAQGLRALDK